MSWGGELQPIRQRIQLSCSERPLAAHRQVALRHQPLVDRLWPNEILYGEDNMKALRTLFVSAAAAGLLVTAAQAQDKTIKIGALFPMSGPGSYFGAQDKQGVELALEQLNKAGVNGYKFAAQYEDSSCSRLPVMLAAKRLIEQFKPDVIIGEECSDATLAVIPVVQQAKVPLLNAGSSSIKVTQPGNPWTFRIMPNEVMQGINLAENASKRIKAETAVLLFENTNAGIGNAQVFKENFTKHGG